MNKAGVKQEKQEGTKNKGDKNTKFPIRPNCKKTSHSKKKIGVRPSVQCSFYKGFGHVEKSKKMQGEIEGQQQKGRKAFCGYMLVNQLRQ